MLACSDTRKQPFLACFAGSEVLLSCCLSNQGAEHGWWPVACVPVPLTAAVLARVCRSEGVQRELTVFKGAAEPAAGYCAHWARSSLRRGLTHAGRAGCGRRQQAKKRGIRWCSVTRCLHSGACGQLPLSSDVCACGLAAAVQGCMIDLHCSACQLRSIRPMFICAAAALPRPWKQAPFARAAPPPQKERIKGTMVQQQARFMLCSSNAALLGCACPFCCRGASAHQCSLVCQWFPEQPEHNCTKRRNRNDLW